MAGISKEEVYLGGLLTNILKRHEIVSVSFINTQLRGKNKNTFITFEFLKKTNFRIFVIGSDLKVSQTAEDKRFTSFNLSDEFFNQLVPILDKDHSAFVQLKKRLSTNSGFAKIQDQVLTWSSNKFKFNLPFLLRNSDKFEIYMENNVSYVRLAEVHQNNMRIEMDANIIWEIVNNNQSDLVVTCLTKILSRYDRPVNQGTLQSCLDYGTPAIDKGFMQRNSSLFVINGMDNSIALNGSNLAAGNISNHQKPCGGNNPNKSSLFNAFTTAAPKSPQKVNVEPFSTSAPLKNNSNNRFYTDTHPHRHTNIHADGGATASKTTTSGIHQNKLSPEIQEKIDNAHTKGQTVVILGNNPQLPAIFIDNAGTSALSNLEMVVAVKQQIASEIETRSFK